MLCSRSFIESMVSCVICSYRISAWPKSFGETLIVAIECFEIYTVTPSGVMALYSRIDSGNDLSIAVTVGMYGLLNN